MGRKEYTEELYQNRIIISLAMRNGKADSLTEIIKDYDKGLNKRECYNKALNSLDKTFIKINHREISLIENVFCLTLTSLNLTPKGKAFLKEAFDIAKEGNEEALNKLLDKANDIELVMSVFTSGFGDALVNAWILWQYKAGVSEVDIKAKLTTMVNDLKPKTQ